MKIADSQKKQQNNSQYEKKTLVIKAYSLNSHNYKNTKITEVSMIT